MLPRKTIFTISSFVVAAFSSIGFTVLPTNMAGPPPVSSAFPEEYQENNVISRGNVYRKHIDDLLDERAPSPTSLPTASPSPSKTPSPTPSTTTPTPSPKTPKPSSPTPSIQTSSSTPAKEKKKDTDKKKKKKMFTSGHDLQTPNGKKLTPARGNECEASYYWEDEMTASGEKFDTTKMTAAHKTLPLGTFVKVTSKATGKSVIVRINDRGPYVAGRCLDLSTAAFAAIDSTSKGVTDVWWDIVAKK